MSESYIPGSTSLPDVTRDDPNPWLPNIEWPALAAVMESLAYVEDDLDALLQDIDDYYAANDPLMMGAGDGQSEPWIPERFLDGPMSQDEWDDYYTRDDDYWGDLPESLDDVITYGNDDTEHLMSNPANAERLLESILQARGSSYGAFEDNAYVAQRIKDDIALGKGFGGLEYDQVEALHQIASKISRIVTGDPDYVDNWDDIAGYAKLVADRLREEQE
jgi:hypothetical protein